MANWKFTLRTTLITITLVALYLGLRRSYVFAPHSSPIGRAWQMPVLFACLAVGVSLTGSTESRIWRSVALGAIVATIVAAALAIEIAEGVRRSYDYWNWSSDWPRFVAIVLTNTMIGAFGGFALACVHRASMRVNDTQNKP